MTLADLRAMARRPAPAPVSVTPVARDPLPTGYRVDAKKIEENRQFQGVVTPVTRVSRDLSNAGEDSGFIPANDPTSLIATTETDDEPLPLRLVQGLSDAEWLDGMVEALAANSVDRFTNQETAKAYFREVALNKLATTDDPLARGLLLGFERYGPSAQRLQTNGLPHD